MVLGLGGNGWNMVDGWGGGVSQSVVSEGVVGKSVVSQSRVPETETRTVVQDLGGTDCQNGSENGLEKRTRFLKNMQIIPGVKLILMPHLQ